MIECREFMKRKIDRKKLKELKNGEKSINEIREALGLSPVPNGDDMYMTYRDYVFLLEEKEFYAKENKTNLDCLIMLIKMTWRERKVPYKECTGFVDFLSKNMDTLYGKIVQIIIQIVVCIITILVMSKLLPMS